MNTSKNLGLSPEMQLAVEAGMKKALKDLKGKEDPRSKVAANQKFDTIRVEMTLEVEGLNIGHDTDKAPTASIPTLAALALMVKRMGIQREDALRVLREVMLEALALDEDASSKLGEESGVLEAVELIKEEVVSKLPRTFVSKKVTTGKATLKVASISFKEDEE